MTTLKYRIQSYDEAMKTLDVMYDDNTWARIGLSNPVPKNVEELELLIKQFAASVEEAEARTAPDADLSYIKALVGEQRETSRKTLTTKQEPVDPIVAAIAEAAEKEQFKKQIKEALVELGVISASS